MSALKFKIGRERIVSGSRLFYYGTRDEVCIGDRVLMKRLIVSPIRGTVCYIPGISPVHSKLEYEGVRQWAIRGENGHVYPICYDPDNCQPPKKIVLVARGTGGELGPEEALV